MIIRFGIRNMPKRIFLYVYEKKECENHYLYGLYMNVKADIFTSWKYGKS